MTALTALWLPILLSAVFVFIASSIIHMAPLWHRRDYPPLPDQEAFRSAVKPMAIPPGDYMVPRTWDMKEMQSPEFQQKMTDGPQMILTVMPNIPWRMGATFVQWFVYLLVIGLFAAYIAGRALAPGAESLEVFRFAGATAFLAYGAALWPVSIWYKRSWSLTIKGTLDALIYACIIGGTFGWLWPR